jgi:chromosome segregation ATPase
MMDDSRFGIGGNQPPQTTADELAEKYAKEIADAQELFHAAQSAPEAVKDDITEGKVSELIKKIRTLKNLLDRDRKSEKEPWDKKVSEVNGFFNTTIEQLERWQKTLNQRSQEYLTEKAEAEKRRLREEEETKNAAKSALDEADRLARDAESAKAAATSEQEIATADVAGAKAKLAHVRLKIANLAAEFARRAKDGNPASDEEKAASRAGCDAGLASAKSAIMAAEEALEMAREKARQAKAELKRAEEEALAQKRAVSAAEREQSAALKSAVRFDISANKLAEKAGGPEADLARTRSLHGAVSTLARRWTCRVIDRTKLDKDALWPFIHEDAISAALFKWMQAQAEEKRAMPGAVIEQEIEGQTR